MPLFFQTMKCAASDELAQSTAWMLLPYSWPMRWNTRSAPVRSTRTATPGNLASNDLAIFSASGRSTEVYHTTLPSFFAASTSAGVMLVAGGAAAMTLAGNAAPAANALDPINKPRREIFKSFIGISSIVLFLSRAPHEFLTAQRPAALGRQMQPDGAAVRDIVAGRRDDPHLRAAGDFHHIVPAVAEKDLPRHRRRY